MVNIGFDSSDQVADRSKHPTPNALVGEIAKPTFDHVKPRTASRHKMQMESGMAFEPRFDFGMLMSGVIVHDQMQVQVRRSLLINRNLIHS